MANSTIYPYGTGGDLPASVGLVNDLTTGGVDKALTAEMGKEIGTVLDSTPVETDNETSGVDLDVADAYGNILARFQGGHFKTKNFDSSNIDYPIGVESSEDNSDLRIEDESGNLLVRFRNGYIQTKYFDAEALNLNTIFSGKKFSFMGDSITTFSGEAGVTNTYYPHGDVTATGQMWFNILTSMCGASICRVSATGGSCITDGYGVSPSFQDRYDALYSAGTTGNAPDFIFVLGGVNDWNTAAPLGSLSDSYTGDTLPTSFIPSYRRLLYRLQTTYPDAEIVALTPMRAYYGNLTTTYPPTKGGLVLNDYAEAISTVCKLHGVVCVDMYNLFNLSLANIETYTIDRLHPTAALMSKMAKVLYQQIINLF